jgi:phenylacetate-coenzyme A ligase PaaK-like adenylate-forming protein
VRERTGLRIEVELVPAGTLPRSAGKAARVIDLRS